MRRVALVVALAALLVAGCGGSSRPKGPPALIFVSVKDGDYAIFGAETDGSHAYRLTKEKGDAATPGGLFFQVQPAWSSDGQEIAFSSGRDGTAHLFVMRSDGTGTRRVTNTDQGDEMPSWSADDKEMDKVEEAKLVAAGTRRALLSNQLAVIEPVDGQGHDPVAIAQGVDLSFVIARGA